MSDKEHMIKELYQGWNTAFIDGAYSSNLAYRPEFISNDYKQGKKVLAAIEQELSICDEFCISVAFITKSGITPLLQILKELESKGIAGKILTTDYLMFSEPSALKKLASLKNIELKMFHTSSETGGFHTKGYIFRREEIYRIILGSSNITLNAITKNREWNTKIVAAKEGEFTQSILGEFNLLWDDENTLSYEQFFEEYEIKYKIIQEQRKIAKKESIASFEQYTLKPNKMQIAFIENLLKMREEKIDRALLISSTGTGKTYASAFALREMQPKRALFIVHREQIAKQAMKSYKKVFGSNKSFGLLSGTRRELDTDFLFSTMQMMAKPEIHTQFSKDEFDIIVIDEVHHVGAESYQKIMSYFTPEFWLGMTASPDTNQYDIYSEFYHNIAYEIRLQQALEWDLLCPFHYFGITDLEINGQVLDDTTGLRNFNYLVSEQRVKYIIEKAEYYGFSGERVKGLVFCSRKEEARELSEKFNQCGYRTEALTGEDSQEKREQVIERLAEDKSIDNQLDYIFTVDIFNEGVDVPEINQIIMLRPTESPVIFIQQLGRGLRKYEDKEYVVVLDFIGNYRNNFMIPIALSGDRSYNKDAIRRYVGEGTKIIPGSSTIHFDEISKQRIYASIDAARTNDLKLLREAYQNLKFKIGRIPTLNEFQEYGSIDVTKIFDKCGSYYSFLVKYEKEYELRLGQDEETIIEFFSKKMISYKRIHELALMRYLLIRENRMASYFKAFMIQKYQMGMSELEENSVIRNLTNEFPKEEEKRKYKDCIFVEKNPTGGYKIAEKFQKRMQFMPFADMVNELLDFGIKRYIENYSDRYKDTNFQLYQKYTYEDVCRLLNWKRNMNAQNIGGYFYDEDTKTLPVFINYDKTEDAIAYEDRFISETELIALSKHPRKLTSSDVIHIYKRSEADKENRIFLFVRKNKNDNEAKEFYFLGEIFAQGEPKPIHMKATNDDAFEIMYHLDVPVRSDIYDYIVNE